MKYTLVATSDDEKDFGRKAADVLRRVLRQYRNPHVGLPTGNTPLPLYRQLVADGRRFLPDFTYGQIDEYIGLPERHPKLFLEEMKANLLEPLGIGITSSFNARSGVGLQRPARFDVAVLGIGRNGHVGFNEPGSSFYSTTRIVSLSYETITDNKKSWDENVYGPFPTQAITRGIGDLRAATSTILLVRGEAKAEILRRALTGPVCADVPASYLRRQDNVIVVADCAARSRLDRVLCP